MAEILYFARLAEELGQKAENLEIPATCTTVADLIHLLRARGQPFDTLFDGTTPVLVAINQEMSDVDARIGNADEIAFFPPVTGG